MKLLQIIFLSMLFGCGGLPFDDSAPPIRNGLYTLELEYDGVTDMGVMGGYFSEDSHGVLKFPLFNEGSFDIVSNRCQFNRSESFKSKSWQYRSFSTQELTESMPASEFACIFHIVLLVDGMDYGMQGMFILIRDEIDLSPVDAIISDRETPRGVGWIQARERSSANVPVYFDTYGRSGTVFFVGCGNEDEKRFEGEVNTTLAWFSMGDTIEPCVYEIGFEFDDGEMGIYTLSVNTFSSQILPLRDPSLSMGRRDRLRVNAESIVGYVAINSEYNRGSSMRKRLSSSDEVVTVRMVTANGRYAIYKVQNGRIVWRPSANY